AFLSWLHELKHRFEFETIQITEELIAKLKESGRKFIPVGAQKNMPVHQKSLNSHDSQTNEKKFKSFKKNMRHYKKKRNKHNDRNEEKH
ncbi:hypothetical protein RFI_37462, partial [Reticulomyxa filosa]